MITDNLHPEQIANTLISPLELLSSVAGYKGLPFPAAWVKDLRHKGYRADRLTAETAAPPFKEYSNKGTAIYKKNLLGNLYYMPVVFVHQGEEYEIDCALVSITGRKNIISTPLVGRKGSVKELINEDDYQVSITGLVIGDDRQFPEEKLDRINVLYTVNEAVTLKCALTDVFLSEDDKVVITDISFPPSAQTEYTQVVEIKCVSDRAFELIIN